MLTSIYILNAAGPTIMVDRNKRRTLKIISGTGAAAFGGALVNSSVLAAASNRHPANTINRHPNSQISIQIISSDSITEDTVIFTNNTSKDIVIHEFLPEIVTLNNQMINLNELCRLDTITVSPSYPVASSTARWEILAMSHSCSYLWCDTAEEHLSDQTSVININAAIVNGRAMLTAENPETAFS